MTDTAKPPTTDAADTSSILMNADKILLPNALKRFKATIGDEEKRGTKFSPHATLNFAGGETGDNMGWTTTHGVVTSFTLPPEYARLSAKQIEDNTLDLATIQKALKPCDDAAALAMVAELSKKAGIPMPLVYSDTTADMDSPALAMMLKDGTPIILIDPNELKDYPGMVKGVIGHEIAHLHKAEQLIKEGGMVKVEQEQADAHNDESGTLSRADETEADLYATTQLGVGTQLKDYLLNFDGRMMNIDSNMAYLNDKTHPEVEQRVSDINKALAGMVLPQGMLQDADHSAKSPAATSVNTAVPAPVTRR